MALAEVAPASRMPGFVQVVRRQSFWQSVPNPDQIESFYPILQHDGGPYASSAAERTGPTPGRYGWHVKTAAASAAVIARIAKQAA
jgi:hypothetical protein